MPFTNMLIKRQWIDQWFFIRYSDPENHLRLRLHLPDSQFLGQVINSFYHILEPMHKDRLIWKIQTDTYEQEVERYGELTMESSERLFHADSYHTLMFLHQMHRFPEEYRWYYGLLATDDLLESFQLDPAEKLRFYERMKTAYEFEFRVKESQVFKKLLNAKFRDHRQILTPLLSKSGPFEDLYALIGSRHGDIYAYAQEIRSICRRENTAVESYLSSYVHMLFNRLFTSNQRLYELTLYAPLHNYYQQVYHTSKKELLVA
ncbi:MAG: thiopeptide-type bacteriocin biosynthesis protein [Lewinellaceae bacterium]|nr:thiopeptide-type bacteriocin biosynthesis protein [Lewinellaceae bacterium]